MKSHILERQQYLRAPMEEVFAFFSDIRNLEGLTPPWLGFRIVTSEKVEMKARAQIDFVIRLAGFPMRWRTRITDWTPGARFVDEQERGPYALWRHEHRFEPVEGGVLMTDRVCYRLPFGLIGRALHALVVRWSLAAIFDYRFDRIRKCFDGSRNENRGQRSVGLAAGGDYAHRRSKLTISAVCISWPRHFPLLVAFRFIRLWKSCIQGKRINFLR